MNAPRGWMAWAGMALIVVVNAIVLSGVAYNRGGEPQAQLELTERELRMPYVWQQGPQRENSGIALALQWRVARGERGATVPATAPNRWERQADWLDAAKLASLGFDPDVLVEAEPDSRGGRPLSRSVWLLLEADGDSYRRSLEETEAWVARLEARPGAGEGDDAPILAGARKQLQQERDASSRLFVIDADLDPEALRARHPDRARHLVMRGRIGVTPAPTGVDRPQAYRGQVEAIDIDRVHVPRQWRALFDALEPRLDDEAAPRYRVVLASGRRHEPWLVEAGALR